MPEVKLTITVSAETVERAYKKLNKVVEELADSEVFDSPDNFDIEGRRAWTANVDVVDSDNGLSDAPCTEGCPCEAQEEVEIPLDEDTDGLGTGFADPVEYAKKLGGQAYPLPSANDDGE